MVIDGLQECVTEYSKASSYSVGIIGLSADMSTQNKL
jgi:hypothetical protein